MAAPAIKSGKGYYYPETRGVESLPGQRQEDEHDGSWDYQHIDAILAFQAPEVLLDREDWDGFPS